MKIILCLLLVLSGLIGAAAQEKTIQKSDFEKVIKNSMELLKAKPYRVTVSSQTNVNGKPQESTSAKTMVDVVSTDKRRFVRESNSADKKTKREFIEVGGKTYNRENEGQWKEGGSMNNSETRKNIKNINEKSEYQSLGKEMLDNQNADVYVRMTQSTRIDLTNNAEISSAETVKYWVAPDGRLLKRELNRENRVGDKIFQIMRTATFDYNQDIQVAAPNL